MKVMLTKALWILLPLLAGCMIGPNYHRPEVDTPEGFRFERADAKDTLNLEWWTLFGDEVLAGLIAEGLAYNKDIKIAAANIEDSIGILLQTRAALFPQIGYRASYVRLRNSLTTPGFSIFSPVPIFITAPNPQTTWQAVLNGSWEVDLWGRLKRLTQAAEANIWASYEARRQVILGLVSTIASSYFDLRGLDEQLAISIKTMESYGESLKTFELQFKYGQASQMLVAQAKTQYELAAAQIPKIQSQIIQLENSMSVLLGRNPGPIARGKSIYDLTLPPVPQDLPSDLLNQRPDLLQAESKLVAANAQIGAAQALYFPQLSLTGFFGNASQDLKNLFTSPSRTWNFTGSFTGPIFTAGAIYGQVQQAEAIHEELLIGYSLAIQQAFAEVESALIAHTMLGEQLEAQGRLVEAAKEYENLATLQFHGGYAPYFAVIQAQQQYFPSQLSWVQTRSQLFSSLVNIYQSMGGGWVTIAEQMTDPNSPCTLSIAPCEAEEEIQEDSLDDASSVVPL